MQPVTSYTKICDVSIISFVTVEKILIHLLVHVHVYAIRILEIVKGSRILSKSVRMIL
jgi:hypothetical protein